MALALSPSEAQSKITAIQNACSNATTILNQVQEKQEYMLGSNWMGSSATGYTHTTQTQNEDFGQIVRALNQVSDIAVGHIKSISSMDNG